MGWFCPLDHETVRQFGCDQGLLPLANDGSGNPYFVDMRHSTLRVVFFDEGDPQPFEVSATFQDFLQGLAEVHDE